MRTEVAAYNCPSDPNWDYILSRGTPQTTRINGNYMVNWGNTTWYQDFSNNPYTGPMPPAALMYLPAPFTANLAIGIEKIVDGTSNTLMMSEIICPTSSGPANGQVDHRGDIWNDDQNSAQFEAYTTPNSTVPDNVPGYCVYPLQSNPPCVNTNPGFNAARSYHSGGVNALMCDGSVRFVKNSINYLTWRGLSTARGNEVISADSL
jgi:prepilin-type processing-associated H-X9-DG protein